MELLQAGVDCSVIALWLGHESVETTQIYLHAQPSPSRKRRRLSLRRTSQTKPVRFRAGDDCSPSSTRCQTVDYAEWNLGATVRPTNHERAKTAGYFHSRSA